MKLGISRPRNQEYRPRKIDGKATKAARTRQARGVQRLWEMTFARPTGIAKAPPIPAPGSRTPQKTDPAVVRKSRSWRRYARGRGRAKPTIRHGVGYGTRQATAHAAPMPSVTDRERRKRRKAQRRARSASR